MVNNLTTSIDTITLMTESKNPFLDSHSMVFNEYRKYNINKMYFYANNIHINLSIPKFLYGDNIRVLSPIDYSKFTTKLEKILHQYSISVNIHESLIRKIAVYKDIYLTCSANDALSLIAKCSLNRRYKPETSRSSGISVLFKNKKNAALQFYNKIAEIRSRSKLSQNEIDISEKGKLDNILRVEFTMLRTYLKYHLQDIIGTRDIRLKHLEREPIAFQSLIEDKINIFEKNNPHITSVNNLDTLLSLKEISWTDYMIISSLLLQNDPTFILRNSNLNKYRINKYQKIFSKDIRDIKFIEFIEKLKN